MNLFLSRYRYCYCCSHCGMLFKTDSYFTNLYLFYGTDTDELYSKKGCVVDRNRWMPFSTGLTNWIGSGFRSWLDRDPTYNWSKLRNRRNIEDLKKVLSKAFTAIYAVCQYCTCSFASWVFSFLSWLKKIVSWSVSFGCRFRFGKITLILADFRFHNTV